jgi:glycosyltransferase involved in cell wall biosynthesis
MRVLLVTDWNRNHGGAEAYVGWLREGLSEAGDEVRLLTSTAGNAANGTADYTAFGTNNQLAQSLLQISNPFAARDVRRAVREFRPDIAVLNMFAHHLSSSVISAIGDVPKAMIVSDYKCICPVGSRLKADGSICDERMGWTCYESHCLTFAHWMRDRPRYALIQSALRRVKLVIACSEWVQTELLLGGIESECVLLPVPAPAPSYRRERSSTPVILFCGRLDIEKGVDDLIRAFAPVVRAHPDAKLRIAGRGPEQEKLEHLAGSLGIAGSVDFLGWLDPSAVEGELSSAWVSVAPSRWAEPLGLVAIEAIVRGVPVIATQSGGFAETVVDGITGHLFPNGDLAALEAALFSVVDGNSFAAGIPDAEIETMLRRHDVRSHVSTMRSRLAEVVRG